jgi:hypothetical protein
MDDIIRKIAGLMAKANGTENEHEAAAFAAKAQEMLAKHNLSEMDVLKQSAEARGESVSEVELASKYVHGWRVALMDAVTKFYFCRTLMQSCWRPARGGGEVLGKKFIIIGKPHNAAVAVSMFTYLEKTTVRLAQQWRKENYGTRSEYQNFENGCGLRIAERLRALMREQQAAKAAAGYTGTTLPALYDSESKAIEEFLSGRKIGKARSRGASVYGRGGYAGRMAGDGVSLNTQVGQSEQRRLK